MVAFSLSSPSWVATFSLMYFQRAATLPQDVQQRISYSSNSSPNFGYTVSNAFHLSNSALNGSACSGSPCTR